jgi:tRNA nucleotidyltransferase (CCA-adding enzyme)
LYKLSTNTTVNLVIYLRKQLDLIKASLDAPLLQILQEIHRAGGRPFIVGGSVRDALFDHISKDCDWDIEVFGLEWQALKSALADKFAFDEVGKHFGILKIRGTRVDIALPRTEQKTAPGHRGFAVATDPNLPLDKAAARRDFTLNAIYYDPIAHKIEDPMGGIADFHKRRLRHCSKKFAEDPLRVLRAMQLVSRFELQIDPATIAMAADMKMEGIAAERFFPEWDKWILLGRKPSLGLQFLRDCGWVQYYPELQALIDCPQDPEWHPEGDAWNHTLHCLDAFAQRRIDSPIEDRVVGFAVLCHDLGKPPTTRFFDGRWRSHGHEIAGKKVAESLLQRIGMPKSVIDEVIPLVETHMRPGQLYDGNCGLTAIRRLSRKVGRMDRLLRVFLADDAGRPPIPPSGQPIAEWLTQKAREENILSNKPQPMLKGRHLIDAGIHPGPAMGKILKKAYILQLQGRWDDLEQARTWAVDQIKAPPP